MAALHCMKAPRSGQGVAQARCRCTSVIAWHHSREIGYCLAQITASMQLREQMGEAQEALTQRSKLQAMVREAHDSLSALQVRPIALRC